MQFSVVAALLLPVVSAAATRTTRAETPSPVQEGITKDCIDYYKAKAGDSCYSIAQDNGLYSLDDFIKWNPAVGKECDGLLAELYYCVGVPGNPTKGSACQCSQWYKVKGGDSCFTIERKFGVSDSSFRKLNKGINKDCTSLLLDYNVCVEA